jgi:hypothetical protein
MPNERDTEPRPAPGPLADEKSGASATREHPQPDAAETESARMIANQARDRLHDDGLDDDEIRRLSERYVAEDRGEDLNAFIDWAIARHRSASDDPAP